MCSPHCLVFGDSRIGKMIALGDKIGKMIALRSLQALDPRYQEGKF